MRSGPKSQRRPSASSVFAARSLPLTQPGWSSPRKVPPGRMPDRVPTEPFLGIPFPGSDARFGGSRAALWPRKQPVPSGSFVRIALIRSAAVSPVKPRSPLTISSSASEAEDVAARIRFLTLHLFRDTCNASFPDCANLRGLGRRIFSTPQLPHVPFRPSRNPAPSHRISSALRCLASDHDAQPVCDALRPALPRFASPAATLFGGIGPRPAAPQSVSLPAAPITITGCPANSSTL